MQLVAKVLLMLFLLLSFLQISDWSLELNQLSIFSIFSSRDVSSLMRDVLFTQPPARATKLLELSLDASNLL